MMVALGIALMANFAPGFFRVEKQGDSWWFLTPSGEKFWSLGVNCVWRGPSKDEWDESNPSYAWWRYHSTEDEWAKEALGRLREWGFNSLGAWCDYQVLNTASTPMPYTEVLYFGSSVKAPFADLFSPEVEKVIDQVAKEAIPKLANDPLLIGWFSDNELGWWDDTLLTYFMAQPKDNYTKKRLVALIESYYGGNWTKLCEDWTPKTAKGFDGLLDETQLVLRPGGHGMRLVNRFTFLLADRYYRLCRDAIRRYDKNHLYLGDRYIQWYPQEVARAASNYVDVVSTNYGADWLTGDISRFFLENLHRLTGKPILVTEFYFCAMENRSGNKNTGTIFPTVDTQEQRSRSFQRNLSSLMRLPYVIGAHWFQYTDEPTHGREDGEDYNMGLVDIHNQPYNGMIEAVKSCTAKIAQREKLHPPRPDTSIPRARRNVLDGLAAWDLADCYIESQSNEPFADLYACWDRDSLYLAVHTAWYADKQLWGGLIPEEDRMQLTLALGANKQSIRVWFGPDAPIRIQPNMPAKQWNQAVRTTMIVSVDASVLAQVSFSDEMQIPFTAQLSSPGRGELMCWEGTLRMRR
ncbi:MAG: hypothetical protein AMXMBFR61_05610 [Fimbriimonadales bacterium]